MVTDKQLMQVVGFDRRGAVELRARMEHARPSRKEPEACQSAGDEGQPAGHRPGARGLRKGGLCGDDVGKGEGSRRL